MAKFRKKRPAVVEAKQFDGTEDGAEALGLVDFDPVFGVAYIETLEGMMGALGGDWIITGIAGERYPCKPGIFTATYEAVDEATWDDAPLPEDAAILAAHPTRSGRHDLYAEAMRLVGAKRSKGALVALVNWLLVRIEQKEGG